MDASQHILVPDSSECTRPNPAASESVTLDKVMLTNGSGIVEDVRNQRKPAWPMSAWVVSATIVTVTGFWKKSKDNFFIGSIDLFQLGFKPAKLYILLFGVSQFGRKCILIYFNLIFILTTTYSVYFTIYSFACDILDLCIMNQYKIET